MKIKPDDVVLFRVEVTEAMLRERCQVVGVCSCGKPAQVVVAFGQPGALEFVNMCFDCSRAHSKAEKEGFA